MTRIICDDSDLALWKRARRYFIGGSDIAVYMGDDRVPDYFRETSEDLVQEKLDGTERVFPPRAGAPMTHGTYSEAHNLEKASKMFGLPVFPYHQLVSHDRWPWLAATLDGLGLTSHLTAPDFSFAREFSREDHFRVNETRPQVEGARSDLELIRDEGHSTIIVELKSTDAHTFKSNGIREWVDRMPPFIECQVQTQMHLMSLPYTLVCGQLGAGTMTGYIVRKDPGWADVMDAADDKASEDLRDLAGAKADFLNSMPIWGHHV